jgi:hypothetical protein
VGGGYLGLFTPEVWSNRPIDKDTWYVYAINVNRSFEGFVQAYALCASPA